MASLYNKNERATKHIHSKSAGIEFKLKGVYIDHGKYYFYTETGNVSFVPFQIDAVRFSITDKKAAKHTAQQDKAVPMIKTYKPLDKIEGKTIARNVFLLDQFTMKNDQLLLIELVEKNGGRHQILKVKNKDLIEARPLADY